MTDREKALKLLQDVRDEVDPDMGGLCDNDCKMVSAWLDEAMALLDDAVEPVKPDSFLDPYECSGCKWSLSWTPGLVKYCPECGRKVDWNA